MTSKLTGVLYAFILVSCGQNERTQTADNSLTEFSNYYSDPTSEKMHSQQVQDTFKLFKAIPKGYSNDSTKKYPLIIVLEVLFFSPTLYKKRSLVAWRI